MRRALWRFSFLLGCAVAASWAGVGIADAQTTLSIARAIDGDGTYTAGATLDIVVTFTKSGDDPFTQMGLEETIPAGWTFAGVVGGPAPDIQPDLGAEGPLNFAWVFPPDPPFNLIYRVNVPLGTTGAQSVSGFAIYATDGPQESSAVVQTNVPFGGTVEEPEGEGAAEGEGEGAAEGEGEVETTVSLQREVANGGVYNPGGVLDITITFTRTGTDQIAQLGLTETLPPGWTFRRLVSGAQPPIAPSANTGGTINFAYITVPAFPVTFTYRVNVPSGATGPQQLSGQGIYATDGPQQFTSVVVSALTEGEAQEEGEGEEEGEEEGEVEGMVLSMSAPAGFYVPGGVLELQVRLRYTEPATVTALGVEQTLPAGWTFNSLGSGSVPQFGPSAGAGGTLEFAWVLTPSFPATFTYRVNVPGDATGLRTITGQANYRTGGGLLLSNQAGVAVPQGEGDPEGEGEVGPFDLTFARNALSGLTYVPGGELEFLVVLDYDGAEEMTGLAVEERFPAGWTFRGISGGNAPSIAPGVGEGGPFGFAWIIVPPFPVTFSYRVAAPADATGAQSVSGNAVYRTGGPEESSNVVVTALEPRPASDLVATIVSTDDPIWVGQSAKVAFNVRNQSDASAIAPWEDCVYLSDDDQPGGDVEVICLPRVTSLASGASYAVEAGFTVPDLAPGDYWVVVAADAPAGGPDAPGDDVAVFGPIRLGVIDYEASVDVALEVLADGSRRLLLDGSAALLADGSPAANAEVVLDIVLRDTQRSLKVVTDGTGAFNGVFELLPTEGGEYAIAARHPGLSEVEPAASIAFPGMALSTPSASPRLAAGVPSNVALVLRNTGDVPLSGLALDAVNAPAGLNVAGTLPASLAAGASVAVNVTLTAATDAVPPGVVTLRATSAEGIEARSPVPYTLRPAGVSLVADSSIVAVGAVPGAQVYHTFDLANDGGVGATNLLVEAPATPWVHVVAPVTPRTLAPGQLQTVTLLIAAPAGQALGSLSDAVRVVADGGVAVDIPLAINVVDTLQGGLRVRVSDELTLLDAEGTAVVGADVRVLEVGSAAVLASGLTDSDGVVVLESLPVGMVDVEARAPGHGVLRGVAVVAAGVDRDLALFVPRQTVGRVWTVAALGDGRIEADFVENPGVGLAPPVISLDPPLIDLGGMNAPVIQQDVLVSNDGLLPAYNLELLFADHPRFSFRPMVDVLGLLPPGASFLVPVLVEDLAFGTPALAVDCEMPIASGLRFSSGAGTNNDQRFVPLAVLLPESLCPGAFPLFGAPPLPATGGPIFAARVEFGAGVECPAAVEPVGEGEGEPEGEGSAEGELEGEGGGEEEGEQETVITLARAGVGGNTYTPGLTVDIRLDLGATGNKPVTSMGIREFLPPGWTFQSVVGGTPPQLGPTPGATGDLDFVWFLVPPLPFSVTYRVSTPPAQVGPQTVAGEAIWSTDGPQFSTGVIATEFSQTGLGGILGSLAASSEKDLANLCARAALRTRATVVAPGREMLFDALVESVGGGLSDVAIALRVEDLDGLDVTGLFEIEQTSTEGLAGGNVPLGSTARTGWSLRPNAAAAANTAARYVLTGDVAYTAYSEAGLITLPGVVVTVLPMPEATVDVFLPRRVFGEDPIAETQVDPEPFAVGVLVSNPGSVAVDTPAIRLVDPRYLGTDGASGNPLSLLGIEVNGTANSAQRLRANLATIPAGGIGQAIWDFEPTFNGALDGLDFALTTRMADGFRTVIEPLEFVEHDLLRVVRVDSPDDDGLPDFLTSDVTVPGRVPDAVHTSDGQVLPVGFATDIEVAFVGKQVSRTFTLTANMPAGWGYILAGIPVDLSYGLNAVQRGDGSTVRAENVWITRRTVRNAQDVPVLEERLHILDRNGAAGSQTYTLEFERLPGFNTAPVANAGPDQTRLLAETAFLSGEGSFDEDGDPLTFLWTVVSRPAGSTAQLQAATSATPTFLADRRGDYVFQLVVNDGIDSSLPDTVTLTIQNRPPVANAGEGFAVPLGDRATLSGAGSSDPDGDPLSYAWSFVSRPAGSTTTLQSANTVAPSFVLDVRGAFEVQLVVSDGALQSAPATVTIRTTNARPVANAGPAQSVALGGTATLDGRASSDPDGDPLTFSWTFSSRPSGSQAVLQGANTARPQFTADRPGSYLVQLVVSDGQLNSTPALVTVSTTNTRPIANAGPNRSGRVGDTVQLDGSASSDPDNNPITYRWSIVSRPSGSTSALSSETAVRPNFRIDEAGTYVFSLIVNDGTLDSLPATVGVSTLNSAPVANAGPDQRRLVGQIVTLNGGGSTDVDDNPLTFRWRFLSRPAASAATLSNPQALATQFTIDVPGDYVVELIVNDGTVDSEPDTVTISTDNTAPVANAGPDRTVTVGDLVVLDGGGSNDADNDELTYQWSFVSRPQGSAATLQNPTTVNPRFTVDVAGDYVVRLVVNDGRLNSTPDTVTISTNNSAPVAVAGNNVSARVGDVVVLDGSGSNDADSDPLTFRWSMSVRPAGSAAALQQGTTVSPRFTVDVAGEYIVQLVVNDGTVDSAPATVRVSTTNSPPVANPGPNQGAQVGNRVQLNGGASVDADNDPLSYRWSFVSRPEGSAAAIEDPAAVITGFTLDEPGTYVVQLVVNDGKVDSAPASLRVSTENSPPVASAGADRTARVGDVVALDGSGSTDPDGDSLTYAWSFTTRPSGSAAALSSATAVAPSFTVDRAGTYVVQLIVNDGTLASPAARVTISTEASPPVAVAGADQTRLVGQLAQLDGSASFDPDGGTLTYSWTFRSRPQASSEALVGPTSARPSFRVDVAGTYVVQLIVSDGSTNSAPATVTVSTENSRPVANPGADQSVRVGARVQLDGNGSSDADGDPLSFQWALTSRPTGSAALLQSATTSRPNFTADLAGQYVVQLIVNDGTLASAAATMRVFADDSGPCESPPAAPSNVSATDGAFADRVAVTWSAPAAGLQYRVWRGNTNDPASAQPISGWINELLYNDTTAPAPTVADAGGGCACGGAPDVNFVVRHYFVEARSAPECVSALSQSDAGYRGAAVKALSEAAGKIAVAGLPSAAVDDLTRMAHPGSALHLRIRHADEDIAEVWGALQWAGGSASATAWVSANEADATDGWLVYTPEAPWPQGARVSFTGGGRTVSGSEIRPVSQTFEIWPEAVPLEADIEARWLGSGGLPDLFGGRGVAYDLAPAHAYAEPVGVMLPVPAGINAEDAALYLYYHDETGPGWYRADAIAGWIVPDSPRVVRSGGQDWLYFEARHGGVVLVGRAPGAMEAAALGMDPAGRAGDFAVLALTALLFLAVRPRRTATPAGRG